MPTGSHTTDILPPADSKVVAVVAGHVVGVIAAHERAIKILPK